MGAVKIQPSFFLSRPETARLLYVSESHIDSLISRGRLRSIRAGRRVPISRASLGAFVRTFSRSGRR
jgi:excisionase family DNA binding protein